MVEAIQEQTYTDISEWWSETEKGKSFTSLIQNTIIHPVVADKILKKLKELGFTFAEKLGEGTFGVVVRLKKEGEKDRALKLEKLPIAPADQEGNLNADARALLLPSKMHLCRAEAILTYDGQTIQYLESFDPELHQGHFLVGVISTAVDGVTMSQKRDSIPFNIEQVKGYGKQLAEALHALHRAGWVHQDLHTGNVMAKNSKEGKPPHRIKLLDFGCASKATPQKIQREWQYFIQFLEEIGPRKELQKNFAFQDLAYHPIRGILKGSKPLRGDQVLKHPFFATPKQLQNFV